MQTRVMGRPELEQFQLMANSGIALQDARQMVTMKDAQDRPRTPGRVDLEVALGLIELAERDGLSRIVDPCLVPKGTVLVCPCLLTKDHNSREARCSDTSNAMGLHANVNGGEWARHCKPNPHPAARRWCRGLVGRWPWVGSGRGS